jgi:hypothetical protein
LVERFVYTEDVGSSSLSSPTIPSDHCIPAKRSSIAQAAIVAAVVRCSQANSADAKSPAKENADRNPHLGEVIDKRPVLFARSAKSCLCKTAGHREARSPLILVHSEYRASIILRAMTETETAEDKLDICQLLTFN